MSHVKNSELPSSCGARPCWLTTHVTGDITLIKKKIKILSEDFFCCCLELILFTEIYIFKSGIDRIVIWTFLINCNITFHI